MSKLCRQVSIESPGPTLTRCVYSFDVPVPDVPLHGARIRVAYAGACYRSTGTRSNSVCSNSSITSTGSLSDEVEGYGIPSTPAHVGLRDGALFAGYEVAGVVDAIGHEAERLHNIREGSRIVLFPYAGTPAAYADYIVVPDLKCLVPIPNEMPLSVAAILPTGALLAMNMVATAEECVTSILENCAKPRATILIVGTGGLALWAIRIANKCFSGERFKDRIVISVATFKDDVLMLTKFCDEYNVQVVQWSEDLHEQQLIERTKDACNGPVDVVLNFGTTSRSLHRSLQCLVPEGVVLVTEEVGAKLLPKFSKKSAEMNLRIIDVPNGTIEQLIALVESVAQGIIKPPPYTVFAAEEAQEVVKKLCNSEIVGRAILKFHDID